MKKEIRSCAQTGTGAGAEGSVRRRNDAQSTARAVSRIVRLAKSKRLGDALHLSFSKSVAARGVKGASRLDFGNRPAETAS